MFKSVFLFCMALTTVSGAAAYRSSMCDLELSDRFQQLIDVAMDHGQVVRFAVKEHKKFWIFTQPRQVIEGYVAGRALEGWSKNPQLIISRDFDKAIISVADIEFESLKVEDRIPPKLNERAASLLDRLHDARLSGKGFPVDSHFSWEVENIRLSVDGADYVIDFVQDDVDLGMKVRKSEYLVTIVP